MTRYISLYVSCLLYRSCQQNTWFQHSVASNSKPWTTVAAVTDYIEETWISSSVWDFSLWSVYGQTIRKNNDCEGWNHKINQRAKKGNLQFYLLITLLYKEASLLPTQVKMVSEGKFGQFQRNKSKAIQGRLFKLWKDYEDGNVT